MLCSLLGAGARDRRTTPTPTDSAAVCIDPELISPDNWTMDNAFLDFPGRDLQPKTLIFWGQGDVLFTPAGGEAYLRATCPMPKCTDLKPGTSPSRTT